MPLFDIILLLMKLFIFYNENILKLVIKMASENKINEYLNALESEKLTIETHFVNIERILKDNQTLEQEKLVALLSNFNTLNIQYEQLCNDLITFIKIFKADEKEIRLYKTEELVELLEAKVNQL